MHLPIEINHFLIITIIFCDYTFKFEKNKMVI